MGLLSEHDVVGLAQKYGLKLFAETGTNSGDGVLHALRSGAFTMAYSIEASSKLCEAAIAAIRKEFDQSRFVIGNIKSPDGVDWILEQLDAPALWWLDAHFPRNFGDMETPEQLPLLDEVVKIVEAERTQDVIIADDMLVWLDYAEQQFSQHLSPSSPGLFRGDPFDIEIIQKKLAPTHEVTLGAQGGGFLMAVPRCLT